MEIFWAIKIRWNFFRHIFFLLVLLEWEFPFCIETFIYHFFLTFYMAIPSTSRIWYDSFFKKNSDCSLLCLGVRNISPMVEVGSSLLPTVSDGTLTRQLNHSNSLLSRVSYPPISKIALDFFWFFFFVFLKSAKYMSFFFWGNLEKKKKDAENVRSFKQNPKKNYKMGTNNCKSHKYNDLLNKSNL